MQLLANVTIFSGWHAGFIATGGYVIWVKLPESVDTLELYRQSLVQGITLAPGYLFGTGSRYRNYIRLNAAMFLDENKWAIERLGDLDARDRA